MANSTYSIIETRCIIEENASQIFIKISDANDFLPISGWYHTTIAADTPCLPFLEHAILTKSFFSWTKAKPY